MDNCQFIKTKKTINKYLFDTSTWKWGAKAWQRVNTLYSKSLGPELF